MNERRETRWPHFPRRSPAPWFGLGIHIGLLIICASAIYTRQPANFSALRWSGIGMLGIFLLASGIGTRGFVALTGWGRLLLALGAGILLTLAYDPQLTDIMALAGGSRPDLQGLHPSVGSVGVGLVLIFWLLFHLAGGEMGMGHIPFRRAVLATIALLVALSAIMYVTVGHLYGLGGEPTRFIVFNVVQYGVLVVGVASSSGGPGVRGWPFSYVGLALLAVVARNLLVVNGGSL